MTSESISCGHCMSPLNIIGLKTNGRHHFPVGQQWECSCGKSKVWTNSLRDPDYFIKTIDEDDDKYYQGVCNDKFCGRCYSRIRVLENGFEIPGQMQRLDRYGCPRCEANQMLLVDGYKELGEGQDGPILKWYESRLSELKGIINV